MPRWLRMASEPLLRARGTWRLAAIMALAVALLSMVAMGLQYRLVAARLYEAQKGLLISDLQSLGALYEQRRIIALREAILWRTSAPQPGELFLLKDRQGGILAGQTPAPLPELPRGEGFGPEPLSEVTLAASPWLVSARELPGGFTLITGRSLAPVSETLQVLRQFMLALMAALLLAGAAVGWFAARSVMRRIGRLNDLADQVAAGDLEARLEGPRSRDEFGLLEGHVHHMLDRISHLNRATHRLSDTIAHEMRTPLNRMLTRLGRIEGQEEEVRALHGEMRSAIRVFDALLDISRAEADQGSGGGLVPLDLSHLAAEVWELYEPMAEEKGLRPEARITPDLRVLGDRTLISQMLANLIDNAIKYCRPGDRLCLSLEGGPQYLLQLADSGPGLPEGMGEEIFERFTRAGRDRARGIPGHGLGLALVRAIALRHGARLSLPPVAQGLTVSIAFPPAPE